MIVALVVIATAVTSVPLAAVALVTIASRSEDWAWTLGWPATGIIQYAARRIVGFRSECPGLVVPKSRYHRRPVTMDQPDYISGLMELENAMRGEPGFDHYPDGSSHRNMPDGAYSAGHSDSWARPTARR